MSKQQLISHKKRRQVADNIIEISNGYINLNTVALFRKKIQKGSKKRNIPDTEGFALYYTYSSSNGGLQISELYFLPTGSSEYNKVINYLTKPKHKKSHKK